MSSAARPFWILGGTLGLLLFASSVPSPLYAVYQHRWGFSSFVLTCVFAVYAIALLAALICLGSLSDAYGRRPVLAVALVALIVAMALFAAATSVVWLFLARVVQGVATGVATSALIAALAELEPSGSPQRAALVSSSAPTFGLAGGALAAGLLVEYGPAPRVLPYLCVLALLVAAVAALFAAVVLIGIGFGLVFMGSFRSLAALASDDDRAELLSAIYVVAYLSMSVPAVAAGLAGTGYGLEGTTVVFACATAATVVVAILGARRPAPEHRPVHVPCPCSAPAEAA